MIDDLSGTNGAMTSVQLLEDLKINDVDKIPAKPPKFEYTPLPSPRHIRLLKILPSQTLSSEEVPQCHLVPSHIDQLPPYEAISYTWGKAPGSKRISIDGKAFPATPTVLEIIRGKRPARGESSLIWIDAICINQADIPEKNVQVPMMGEIYGRATGITVWLGQPATADSAVQLLRELVKYPLTSTMDTWELHEKYLSELRSPRWLALGQLLRHPWFSRIWIVQEVALAAPDAVVVQYGRHRLEWAVVTNVMRIFADPRTHVFLSAHDGESGEECVFALGCGQVVNRIHGSVRRKEVLDLQDLSMSCKIFKATDSRDKVFAILGLTGEKGTFLPDYHWETKEVFRRATARILARSRDYAVLALAGVGNHRSVAGLESWVADFSPETIKTPLSDHSPTKINSAATRYRAQKRVRVGSDTIKIGCMKIDTIAHLGPEFEHDPSNDNNAVFREKIRQIYAAYDESWAMVRAHVPPVYRRTRQPRKAAFWRTLIGDFYIGDVPAPGYLAEVHDRWADPTTRPGGKNAHMGVEALYGEFISNKFQMPSVDISTGGEMAERSFGASKWYMGLGQCAYNRRLVLTTNDGWLGMAPPLTRKGDLVVLPLGSQTPLVVRKVRKNENNNNKANKDEKEGDKWELVGECYVHGMMRGEIKINEALVEWFELI